MQADGGTRRTVTGMRSRLVAPGVSLLVAVALLAGCAGTGSRSSSSTGSSETVPTTPSVLPAVPSTSLASTSGTLIALGDSFASGVGARGMVPACGRSPYGWPGLLAAELGMAFVNMACSGATLPDTIAQVEELPDSVDVVAVTSGGNSLKFTQAVLSCLNGDCAASQEMVMANLPDIRPGTVELLTSIRAARPGVSAIVLTLYPLPVRPGAACGRATEEFADLFAQSAALLNSELRSAAEEARRSGVPVVVVDPAGFGDHDLCSAAPWFHGFEKGLLMLHLNDDGYAAIADTAREALAVAS